MRALDVGRPRRSVARDGDADRAQQRVRQLERVRARDVEAVEEPVADEVEVAGHGRARVAVERAQRARAPRRDRRPTRAAACARGILRRSRRSAARARADAPADTGDAPRIRPSSSAGGRPVQSPTCARKSPVGTIAARREAHVLVDHLGVVVAAARQVRRPARRRRARRGRPTAARGASAIEAGLNVSSHSRSCSRQSLLCERPPRRAGSARGPRRPATGTTDLYAKPLTYAISSASISMP